MNAPHLRSTVGIFFHRMRCYYKSINVTEADLLFGPFVVYYNKAPLGGWTIAQAAKSRVDAIWNVYQSNPVIDGVAYMIGTF